MQKLYADPEEKFISDPDPVNIYKIVKDMRLLLLLFFSFWLTEELFILMIIHFLLSFFPFQNF